MGGAEFHVTASRILGALLVVVCFAIAGGVIASIIGDATAIRHALAYGFGWQGLVGGLLKAEPVAAHKSG